MSVDFADYWADEIDSESFDDALDTLLPVENRATTSLPKSENRRKKVSLSRLDFKLVREDSSPKKVTKPRKKPVKPVTSLFETRFEKPQPKPIYSASPVRVDSVSFEDTNDYQDYSMNVPRSESSDIPEDAFLDTPKQKTTPPVTRKSRTPPVASPTVAHVEFDAEEEDIEEDFHISEGSEDDDIFSEGVEFAQTPRVAPAGPTPTSVMTSPPVKTPIVAFPQAPSSPELISREEVLAQAERERARTGLVVKVNLPQRARVTQLRPWLGEEPVYEFDPETGTRRLVGVRRQPSDASLMSDAKAERKRRAKQARSRRGEVATNDKKDGGSTIAKGGVPLASTLGEKRFGNQRMEHERIVSAYQEKWRELPDPYDPFSASLAEPEGSISAIPLQTGTVQVSGAEAVTRIAYVKLAGEARRMPTTVSIGASETYVVTEGCVDVELLGGDGVVLQLAKGDTVTFSEGESYGLKNPESVDAVFLWTSTQMNVDTGLVSSQ